jgi:hypothetical protein
LVLRGERREEVMDKINVVISVKDGAVIDVEAPPQVDVVIRDYDVDGINEDLLDVDEEGDLYREMIW